MTTLLIVLAIAVVLVMAMGPTVGRRAPRRRVVDTVYEDDPMLVEQETVTRPAPRRRFRRWVE